MRVGPTTPTVPTTCPSTSYGAVTTLHSSSDTKPDSPPMKICTPSARPRMSSSRSTRRKRGFAANENLRGFGGGADVEQLQQAGFLLEHVEELAQVHHVRRQ